MNTFLLIALIVAIFAICVFAGRGKSAPIIVRDFEHHGSE